MIGTRAKWGAERQDFECGEAFHRIVFDGAEMTAQNASSARARCSGQNWGGSGQFSPTEGSMVLKLAVMLVLGAVLAVGCATGNNATGKGRGTTETAGSVTLLAPTDYQSATSRSDAFVVNVHVPYEGEIDGTDAFIPFDSIEEHAAELPTDKTAPLYIYCRSGRMSAAATPALQRLGYVNIIDLKGGMQAWEAAGLVLVRRDTTLPH